MSYWSLEYDVPISMTFFRTFHRSGSSRINMGVDRIILLIVIIGVVENRTAPNSSGGSSCGNFKGKYLFVLTPAANRIDLLTDLVKLAQSAIVTRSGIESDPHVHVIVSPENFTEFEKKSRALRVYKSHILQCVNETTNLAIAKLNISRAAGRWIEISGKTNEKSSLEFTTRLAPKGKELDDKMCTSSNVCEPEFKNNLINASLTNDVKKSLETTATSSINSGGLSTSRIVRALKTKKGTWKQKSKVKTIPKFLKGNTRVKPKEQKKSAKEKNRNNSAKKLTKADVASKKTTLIQAPRTSTHGSWNKLMSIAAKSLTKSNNTHAKSKPGKEVNSSIAIRKLFSSAKLANAKKSANNKQKTSKQVKRPETKKMRKPGVKTSTSAKKQTQSLNTRNRINQQRKSFPKSQGRRKPSPAVNSKIRKKIGPKNRKPNRDSRELKISTETGTACMENNSRKRSLGRLAKRDFSFRAPGGCTVIKISNSCDGDCSENSKNSGDTINLFHKLSSSKLFIPLEVPAGPIPDSLVPLPVYPNTIAENLSGPQLFDHNKNSDTGVTEDDAVAPQSLPPGYESQEEPPKLESVDPYNYLGREKVDKEPIDKPSITDPLHESHKPEYPPYKPSPVLHPFLGGITQNPLSLFGQRPENIVGIPQAYSTMPTKPFAGPFEVPIGFGEDIEDPNDYDEDDEIEYGNDDDNDDDWKENYEEFEGYEEEKRTEIPTFSSPIVLVRKPADHFLMHFSKENNKHVIGNSKGEDSYEDKENYDDDDDYEDYVEDSGNGEIGYENDYYLDDD